jgi:hypothetical protein
MNIDFDGLIQKAADRAKSDIQRSEGRDPNEQERTAISFMASNVGRLLRRSEIKV